MIRKTSQKMYPTKMQWARNKPVLYAGCHPWLSVFWRCHFQANRPIVVCLLSPSQPTNQPINQPVLNVECHPWLSVLWRCPLRANRPIVAGLLSSVPIPWGCLNHRRRVKTGFVQARCSPYCIEGSRWN